MPILLNDTIEKQRASRSYGRAGMNINTLWSVLTMITAVSMNSKRMALLILGVCLAYVSTMSPAYAENLAPDCSQATVTPSLIWPADNKFVPLNIQGITDPENQTITLETQCILQDEPIAFWRRYWHWNDWSKDDGKGLATDTPSVRASSRSWFVDWHNYKWVKSDGRVYDVIFKATDSEGAVCSGKVTVGVPIKENRAVKDNHHRYPSLSGGENCNAMPFNNPPIITSDAITEAKVDLNYSYAVIGHDPDQDTLSYALPTAPVGMTVDAETGLIQWTPMAEQEGVESVVIEVSDVGGLKATQSFDITVAAATFNEEVSIAIIANPVTGTSPLTVRFSSDVQNNNVVITGYAWDFDGDSTTDRSDSFGAPQTYTYTGNPGDTFTATLTVTTNSGDPLVASKIITLTNQPPTVQVTSNTTNGHTPLAVSFITTAQDPQGIAEISIDFDGDGTVDSTQAGNGDTSGSWTFPTTYQDQGTYVAVVRVTDTVGAETLITNNAITVDVNDPLDPIIQVSATPMSGTAPLLSSLSASVELFDGSTIRQWRWDLDGDGVFETQGGVETNEIVNFTYKSVNNFYPTVEVETNSGRIARASLRIETLPPALPSLNIPDNSDTINSDAGESANFTVTLSV